MVIDGLDVRTVGEASGLLWSRGNTTIAGVGEAVRIAIERPTGAAVAQAELAAQGAGTIAFAALPFDRDEPGELIVPSVVLVATETARRVITKGVSPEEAHVLVEQLLAVRRTDPEPTRIEVTSPVRPETWRDEVVAPARDAIRAGEVRKIVLAREVTVTADQPIDVQAVLRRLGRAYGTSIVFAVDGFVGASPELLVARDGDQVTAHPLAGTSPRSSDPNRDRALATALAASTKNAVEHRITIDWLLDNLLPFCSYVDAEPEPTIVSLANVHHLGTRVEGRLSAPAASVLDLVAALHPTPAVGGDPQGAALDAIEAIEPGARGRYAGPVGWVDASGNGEFAVGIRSATIDGQRASAWAGVGVVADSDPQAELDETRAKFEAMLGALLRP